MTPQGKILLVVTTIDSIVTAVGVSLGHLEEVNSAMVWIMGSLGIIYFVAFKIALVLCAIRICDQYLMKYSTSCYAGWWYSAAVVVHVAMLILGWIWVNTHHLVFN